MGEVADYVILGAGILGTTLAAQAALAGHKPLVLRLNDQGRPRADSLRNQGWLQSGLLFKPKDFATDKERLRAARKTRYWGRRMLEECELSINSPGGVLRAKPSERAEWKERAKELRFKPTEFQLLTSHHAHEVLGELFDADSEYFSIPDCPFDEAGVLRALRARAVKLGVNFVNIDSPIEMERDGDLVRLWWRDFVIESPLLIVAAGVASIGILGRLGYALNGYLRQTPLLVHNEVYEVKVPIVVDRKFSIVRHPGNPGGKDVLAVGTVIRQDRVPFVEPDKRRIRPEDILSFRDALSDKLKPLVDSGRFTAGVELIPEKPRSLLEDWIEDFGSVVFASPGRATLSWFTAIKLLNVIHPKLKVRSMCRVRGDIAPHWIEEIHMHFSSHYGFDDRENGNG